MFIAIFLSVYCLVNFYVLRRLFSLFSLKVNILFYVLLVICTFSYLLAAILERTFANTLTKIFYNIAAMWMGVGFLLFCCLGVFEIVNLIFSLPKSICGWTVLAVTFILTVYSMINASRLKVVSVDIDAPVSMNIVQLCDIHLGSTSTAFLSGIVETTNALYPDIVVITGDLLDSHRPLTAEALAPLNSFTAPVFFVTGNHEDYFGIEKAMALISTTKVKPLRNETAEFRGINLIGIDHSHNSNQVAEQLRLLSPDPAKYNILMYHCPQGLEAASKSGIDLMLSGHTHSGQIFPFNYFVRLKNPYIKGLYRNGVCSLFVSSGTGTWGPGMRLGSYNQIVLLRLSPSD